MHLRGFEDFKQFVSQNEEVKRVMVRCDLNIPSSGDLTRVNSIKETVLEILDLGLKVVLVSHYRRPAHTDMGNPEYSLSNVVDGVSKVLGCKVQFLNSSVFEMEPVSACSDVTLLENVRFYRGEIQNSDEFAKRLAEFADVYINDAFSVSHRKHASVVGITEYLPSFAGLSLQKEVREITRIISDVKRPFTSIIGGAKVSTKIDILQKMSKISDYLMIAGAMSNTFLAARGFRLGGSKFETEHFATALDVIRESTAQIVLPCDFLASRDVNTNGSNYGLNLVPDDCECFDIGEESIEQIINIVAKSGTVLWNGPTGAFEFANFGTSSKAIAEAIAKLTNENGLVSVIGGGETVAAVGDYKDDMSLISTGGGAFLELITGKKLPGITALEK
jgi:phosphoglycerate kinase